MTHTASRDSRHSTPPLLALEQVPGGGPSTNVAAWGVAPSSIGTDLKLESVPDGVRGDLRENLSGAGLGLPLGHPSAASSTLAPKKRGRPKGWRPGMSYSDFRELPKSEQQAHAAAHVATQTSDKLPDSVRPQDSGFPKRRGRPPKVRPLTPGQFFRTIKEPEFAIFACEWRMCKAELHNIDTLRRHLHVVHQPARKPIIHPPPADDVCKPLSCRWARCTSEFNTSQDWRDHVEERHLAPLSWHVGDGVRNNGDVFARASAHGRDELPNFLFDKQGNQVTPSVRYQELEDEETYRANRHKLEQLYIKINAGLDSDSEDEEGSEAPNNDR